MTKRYAEHLLALAFAILKDCEAMFPADGRELKRDRSRLASLVKERGIAVFTLDFPAIGKHLDKCLVDGAYTQSYLPHTRRYKKGSVVPRLFRGLHLRIFDDAGMLRSEPDINAISALRQLYAFAKKFRIDCKREAVYETVRQFAEADKELPYPTLAWDSEVLDPLGFRHGLRLDDRRVCPNGSHQDRTYRPVVDSILLERCQRVFDIVSATLGSFDPYGWRPKHGPGAVADLSGGSYKFNFPQWSARLDSVFPYSDFAFANHRAWIDDIERDITYDDSVSSKLYAVPKTQKGPRLIAAEPTAHQWCQQILWDFFKTRCQQSWIGDFVRFTDQTANQEAARKASRHGDHWTVDLSAASDCVSLWLVERAFKGNIPLLNALHASRTRFLSQEIDKKTPSRIELLKFSTMGSACTFPVESLIFMSIAIASVLHVKDVYRINAASIRRHCRGIQIFGDDIVIPSIAGDTLEQLLGYLNFKVNQTKTCRNGRFRESCGLEAYDGVDVTPSYYLRVAEARTPESVISSVECSNNFYKRGWWNAADYIKSTVTVGKILTVGVGSGAFGWQTFGRVPLPGLTRESKHLHRTECRGIVIKTLCQRAPVEGNGPLLQYFTEEPDPELPWKSGAPGRPKTKLRLGWVALPEIGWNAEAPGDAQFPK